MLVLLPAWIVVTFICWAWGILVIQLLKRIAKDESFILPVFSVVCMTGLAAVTVFAAIVSLFLPLGSWLAHLIVILPCGIVLFKKFNTGFVHHFAEPFKKIPFALIFLLIASVALVLLMASWKVNHPDTLTYHAQTIQWIEEFKAVPGLVHLHPRLGYQGLWFVAEAFFDLSFTGIGTLTLINSVTVLWFFLFIAGMVSKGLREKKWNNTILWLLLMTISLLCYTQARLTLTSASPDFITVLYVWLTFYLFASTRFSGPGVHWLLIIFFSVVSVALKLSAIPVVFLAVIAFIKLCERRNGKAILMSCMIGVFVFVPFIARNVITSGYMVYPSTTPDVFTVDWKAGKAQTAFEKDYITAYARTQVEYDETKVKEVMSMGMSKWLPAWWKNQKMADRAILLLLMIAILLAIARVKRVFKSGYQTTAAMLIALGGVIFWFVQAPDPRFGYGFIIAFIGIVAWMNVPSTAKHNNYLRGVTLSLTLLIAGTISVYSIYRAMHFFDSQQLARPMGIEAIPFSSFDCNGIKVSRPDNKQDCGNIPIPCVYSDSCQFELRGPGIEDGFKAKP